MARVEIQILGFSQYQKRKDLKKPHWFAFSNRFFDDPDFFGFSSDEKLAWIYLLSQASLGQSPKVEIIYEVFFRRTGFSVDTLLSTIEKLESKKIIKITDPFHVEPTVIRTESVRDPDEICDAQTNKQTNKPLSESKTAEVDLKTSSQKHDDFYSPEKEKFKVVISEAFEGKIPPDIRNLTDKLFAAYGGDIKHFALDLQNIVNKDLKDPSKMRGYIAKSLKNLAGAAL